MRNLRLSTAAALLSGLAFAVTFGTSGCLGTDERVLGITGTGTIQGVVFFDVDGNRNRDAADLPQPDVRVRMVVRGTRDTLARVTSNSTGEFVVSLPVGGYDVAVDLTSVADSVQVVRIDPASFAVQEGDTIASLIAVSFAKLTIAEARALPPGERVFVEGTALTGRATFGDRSVHLVGRTGAIRVTRVRPADIIAGDSLRFLGRIVIQNGQPTLDDAAPFPLGVVEQPDPEAVSTAVAATADGSRLDAALVEIAGATIQDTATVVDGLQLSVNDGSGALGLLLDRDVPFTNLAVFVPGAQLDAQGVLVPTAGGATWQLKPRSGSDISVR